MKTCTKCGELIQPDIGCECADSKYEHELCDNCGHQRAQHGDWTGECFSCTCQQFTKERRRDA